MGKSDCFDELLQWANLDRVSLQASFTQSNVEVLRETVSLLGSDQEKQVKITKSNFVELIGIMKQRYVEGSRALGGAIIAASELHDDGKVNEAVEVYREFLRNCPSEFYKKIAEYQIRKLTKD